MIGGIGFGWVDAWNGWLLLANAGAGQYELYEVTGDSGSGHTFTLRASGGTVGSSGGTFSLSAEVRSGSVEKATGVSGYTATIPAGKVGVWAADGSAAVKADDFKVTDNALPKDVDGLFFSHAGDASVTGGVLRIGTTLDFEEVLIRRGFRGGQYIVEADVPKSGSNLPGFVLHYQDIENFMAVVFDSSGFDTVPKLVKRVAGVYSAVATSTGFSMTSGEYVGLRGIDPLGLAREIAGEQVAQELRRALAECGPS